jgi:hypothetical protein
VRTILLVTITVVAAVALQAPASHAMTPPPGAQVASAPSQAAAPPPAAPSAFRTKSYAPVVAAALALLFLLPFVDLRRPFRLLHLDVVALLGFAVPHALYRSGESELVAWTTFPLLAYLLVRMLYLGLGPRPTDERLVPYLGLRTLVIVLVAVVCVRVGIDVADSEVSDVGYASVIGADRVAHGDEIYEGTFPALTRPGYVSGHGDTYGPVTYFAYVPFETAFPWSGRWDSLPAAHAAAIAFDLLTLVGLFLLGRAVRPSRGNELGVALAYAWACYPYTFYVLVSNTNDALVSALVVWSLLLVHRAPLRGAAVALAGAAKYVALALAPLFATATDRRPRAVLAYSAAFVAVFLLVHAPLLPDGGFREIYDRTLGFQDDRSSVFTIWHAVPSLDAVRPVAVALAALLALGVALVPRRRTPAQLAGLGAAVLIAVELAHAYWFVFYLVWWAPLAFAALFAVHRD